MADDGMHRCKKSSSSTRKKHLARCVYIVLSLFWIFALGDKFRFDRIDEAKVNCDFSKKKMGKLPHQPTNPTHWSHHHTRTEEERRFKGGIFFSTGAASSQQPTTKLLMCVYIYRVYLCFSSLSFYVSSFFRTSINIYIYLSVVRGRSKHKTLPAALHPLLGEEGEKVKKKMVTKRNPLFKKKRFYI